MEWLLAIAAAFGLFGGTAPNQTGTTGGDTIQTTTPSTSDTGIEGDGTQYP